MRFRSLLAAVSLTTIAIAAALPAQADAIKFARTTWRTR
jgi:hypothetical protein